MMQARNWLTNSEKHMKWTIAMDALNTLCNVKISSNISWEKTLSEKLH